MPLPEPIIESARAYCGDLVSHQRRGELILTFLRELGLQPHHRVLNVGCGTLSEGAPLIRFLEPGHFTGCDPGQWLIRAAIEHEPQLLDRDPDFLFVSDYDCKGAHPFDFVVSHSVLSHVAFWEMATALTAVRKAVEPGARWLASLRLGAESSFDSSWVYPGNSIFRLQDVQALAYQAGWTVAPRGDLQARLQGECPADIHDWIVLTAGMSPDAANDLRLDMDARNRDDAELRTEVQELRAKKNREAVARMSPGWLPSMEGTIE